MFSKATYFSVDQLPQLDCFRLLKLPREISPLKGAAKGECPLLCPLPTATEASCMQCSSLTVVSFLDPKTTLYIRGTAGFRMRNKVCTFVSSIATTYCSILYCNNTTPGFSLTELFPYLHN